VSTRVFLVFTYSEDPNVDYDQDQIVAAANFMLPVLWCTLFTQDDIYWRHRDLISQYASDDGRGIAEEDEQGEDAYPIFLTGIELAKQRAIERREPFFQALPQSLAPIYADWLTLLDGIDAPHLLMDTFELWAMMGAAGFEQFLTECVAAFENTDPLYWSTLLRQATMSFDSPNRRISFTEENVATLLHGYEWMRSVPWTEPWSEDNAADDD